MRDKLIFIGIAIMFVAVASFSRGSSESDHPRYQDYTEEAYVTHQGKVRVLFFHAAWCPSCRSADAGFKQAPNDIPEQIVVFKVDYDKERELKKKYAIAYQHTFVQVDADGEAVSKWSGGALDKMLEEIKLD